jgi:TatD DNase family protein
MSDGVQAVGVDFHCHLDLYPDYEAAVFRAESARIYTLTVTTTPKAWPRNASLTRDLRFVRAALGLHPQLVADRADELSLWEAHLPETRYVGEVGLDAGPRHYKSLEQQKRVFQTVLERCAAAGDKILTLHSVRSAPAVLQMVEAYLPRRRGQVVLHWFTGTSSEARRAVDLGCFFSINAEMTATERGRSLVAALPLDRVLTETDGPFTAVADRPAEPAQVTVAVDGIAAARGMDRDEVAQAILQNLGRLVRS